MVNVRSAKEEDIKHISKNIRQSDREELSAVGIDDVGKALYSGMENSSICLSIADKEDRAMAMFGIIGELDKPASVWLLGTDNIGKFKKAFMKISRNFIKAFLLLHPFLINYVDERNGQTIKWLKRLGAVIEKPEPHGTKGMNFRKFYFKRCK